MGLPAVQSVWKRVKGPITKYSQQRTIFFFCKVYTYLPLKLNYQYNELANPEPNIKAKF